MLIDKIKSSRKALARTITIVENNLEGSHKIGESINNRLGYSHIVGVTGPPGVGKSSLIDAAIPHFRKLGNTVAVLAVDPSSHLSGGAILGDRVRMAGHTDDNGVFIRSVAARGHLGGISATTLNIINLFDAAQWDTVVVETVGSGQSEIDISAVADTTVVVESPNLGDDVQAIKAGQLEIADIVALNKSDLPQTDVAFGNLSQSLALRQSKIRPKILKTVATTGSGVSKLVDEIFSHRKATMTGNRFRHAKLRTRSQIAKSISDLIKQEILESNREDIKQLIQQVQLGSVSFEEIVHEMLDTSIGNLLEKQNN